LEDSKQRPFALVPLCALGKLGANARAAVPVLIKLLDYQDEDARRSALVALIKIGLEPWYDRWEDSFSNDRTDDPFRTGSDFTDALRRIGKDCGSLV
jgi:hypothetical protein